MTIMVSDGVTYRVHIEQLIAMTKLLLWKGYHSKMLPIDMSHFKNTSLELAPFYGTDNPKIGSWPMD